MLEALWAAFSHPATIAGGDGAGTLIVLAALAALITVGFMATLGRRVMTHSSIIAVLLGCAFLPSTMNILAFLIARSQPVGTDGGGILVFAALILSICALPITLATSLLYVVLRRRRLTGRRAPAPAPRR